MSDKEKIFKALGDETRLSIFNILCSGSWTYRVILVIGRNTYCVSSRITTNSTCLLDNIMFHLLRNCC